MSANHRNTSTKEKYSPRGLTRVDGASDLEYFRRDLFHELSIHDALVFPAHNYLFDIALWRENAAEVLGYISSLDANDKRAGFWSFAKQMLEENVAVFESFGNHSKLVVETLRDAQIPEIQNKKIGRNIALCVTHDNDGKVLEERCEEVGVETQHVALMVTDAHNDMAIFNGKNGAIRMLADEHAFGKVIVFGLPESQVEELQYDVATTYNQMYVYIQSMTRPFAKPLQGLTEEEFIAELKQMIVWSHATPGSGEKEPSHMGSLNQTIRSHPMLQKAYAVIIRNSQIERLNKERNRMSFLGQHITKADLEHSFAEMQREGITHLLWNIDPDAFDLTSMKVTGIEYSNWGMFAMLGMQNIAGRLSLQPADKKGAFIERLFFGSYELPMGVAGHATNRNKNALCQYNGLTLEDFGEQAAMVRELAQKYHITIGIPNKDGGTFYGTITELVPNAPDYNGNTAALVKQISGIMAGGSV